jgi:hypothetical protein
MAVDQEAPYQALADRIQTYCKDLIARPVSRKAVSFDQIASVEQPCIFVLGSRHIPRVTGPALAAWDLEAIVEVYARADASPDSSAEPILNTILTTLCDCLRRQSGEVFTTTPGQRLQAWTTLGGLVMEAVPGEVTMWAGPDGRQGVAQFAVTMRPQPA